MAAEQGLEYAYALVKIQDYRPHSSSGLAYARPPSPRGKVWRAIDNRPYIAIRNVLIEIVGADIIRPTGFACIFLTGVVT